MRDLLSSVKKGGNQTAFDTDLEHGYTTGSESIQKFFSDVTTIRNQIELITNNTLKMDQIYEQTMKATRGEDVNAGSAEVESIITETNRVASSVRKALQAMKDSNKAFANEEARNNPNEKGQSADCRLRESQHASLSKKFIDAVSQYQESQTKWKQKQRQRFQRQYKIVKPDANEDEIDKVMESKQNAVFSQTFLDKRQEVQEAYAYIQNKHQEILKLEESLRELQQLFIDMQVLVEAQGEMLNEIEKSVDKAVDYTEKGAQEMRAAVRLQKKSRKKMLILGCCLICLLLIVIIPIAVTLT